MGNPISRELFLERARSRFGDQYDYSAIVYKSYKTPIKITPPSPLRSISKPWVVANIVCMRSAFSTWSAS